MVAVARRHRNPALTTDRLDAAGLFVCLVVADAFPGDRPALRRAAARMGSRLGAGKIVR